MSTETNPMEATTPVTPAASRRRIPPVAYGLLVIAIFAGVIGIGMASGTFQTTGKTTAGGERVAPQGESVTEIKGWMAIGEVANAWAVPLPELLAAFDLPADTAATMPLKDLESDVFSVMALRDWIGAREAAGQ
ncbi:MAG TPA: hypothetical protein VES19_17400 [Candidatus Limnocylindrales bacterium]|nr:hypothetical protein [Candidatus Limnocylindrales bacterium]